jgi:hypothetical protein
VNFYYPEAEELTGSQNIIKFLFFSNCLKPDRLISAVQTHKPHRLYISLDGSEETYLYMQENGYKDAT